MQCVCRCGSSAREVSCSKSAAMMLPVARSALLPACRTRVAANRSSSFTASFTAARCASTIRESPATSAAIETDFGGEKVKSKNTRRFAISPSFTSTSRRECLSRCVSRFPGFRMSIFAKVQKTRLCRRVLPIPTQRHLFRSIRRRPVPSRCSSHPQQDVLRNKPSRSSSWSAFSATAFRQVVTQRPNSLCSGVRAEPLAKCEITGA